MRKGFFRINRERGSGSETGVTHDPHGGWKRGARLLVIVTSLKPNRGAGT